MSHELDTQDRRQDECHHHPDRHRIPFFVDTEETFAFASGATALLRVEEILDISGNQPASDYYLVAFGAHHEQQRFEDLTKAIEVHPGEHFCAVFKGPTPVS